MKTKTLSPGIAPLAVLLLLSLSLVFISVAKAKELTPRALPEFTNSKSAEWINSKPLSIQDLKGKVVMLDFWTFECWNCYRSFPWLHELEAQFKDQPFQVVGVHTPEFEHERRVELVQDKVKEFGLVHPVVMDNDFSYWNALGTRYWPSFYLVDKQGKVRYVFVGETHSGSRQAKAIEQAVNKLLAE